MICLSFESMSTSDMYKTTACAFFIVKQTFTAPTFLNRSHSPCSDGKTGSKELTPYVFSVSYKAKHSDCLSNSLVVNSKCTSFHYRCIGCPVNETAMKARLKMCHYIRSTFQA
uniref:Uncharacterized protein n=1 Tax=Schistocephalus solidus TaxID=70667 RepID=A0A0X3PWD8_SCHSO